MGVYAFARRTRTGVTELFKKKAKKEEVKKESAIVTKESLCSTFAIFSLLALFMLCTRSTVFGEFGVWIHSFLTGACGYLAYPALLGTLYLSVTGLLGKRLVKRRSIGWAIACTALCATLVVQLAVTYSWSLKGYAKACFLSGEDFPKTAPAGWIGGMLIAATASGLSKIGAIVLFSLLTLGFGYVCARLLRRKAAPVQERVAEEEPQPLVEQPLPLPSTPQYAVPQTGEANPYATPTVRQRPGVSLTDTNPQNRPSQGFSPFGVPATMQETPQPTERAYDPREILFGGTPAENYRKNLLFDPTARVNNRPPMEASSPVTSSYVPSYVREYENAINEEQRPAKVVSDRTQSCEPPTQTAYTPSASSAEASFVSPTFAAQAPQTPPAEREFPRETPVAYAPVEEPPVEVVEELPAPPARGQSEPYRRHEYMDLFSPSNPNVFGNTEETADFGRDFADRAVGRGRSFAEEERSGREGLRLLDDEDEPDPYTLRSDFDANERESARGREFSEDAPVLERGRGIEQTEGTPLLDLRMPEPAPAPKAEVEPPKPRIIRPYVRARLDDFDCRDIQPTANEEEVRMTKENILATLEEFKITGASIASVTFGPTVTRYNVTIPRSISPKKVVSLDQSIAINLHSNGVNIYPNYEDGVVSIEVPNRDRQFVQLGCMLSGDTFVNAKSSSLMFAMGKDVANRKVYGDISKMIHLLVAGSSGSGKSVFLGSLIISLIYKYSPEELRLILIDPKKTEFVLYNNLPHLMINEIITDPGKAVQSLNWAIGEMNRRYSLFEKMSRSGTYVVNLDQYNEQLDKAERLPKIVIIIDELADLMLAAKKDMEDRIQNLTQKARAAGIHLIVATQRPSTDVITGVIKSNLATRVAFYVASDVDSRVILDQSGAQKLLGKGDFLYTMPGVNTPVRVQSAFISPEESQRIVNFIKSNNEAYYDEEATAYINSRGGNGGEVESGEGNSGGDGGVDPMYVDALRYVIVSNAASISMIQRKCSTGYNRAGKIIEWMEDMGYISPFDGAKARKVLITPEEFESKYGPL